MKSRIGRTWWIAGMLGAAIAGCLGSPPGLLSSSSDAGADGGPAVVPPNDATVTAMSDGGAPPADAGVGLCSDGSPCAPTACQLGTVACSASGSACTFTENQSDGTDCDAGADASGVCSGGNCQACATGADCTEAGSCQQANLVCASGSPVCTQMGNVVNGKACGSSLFCNAGKCAPCTPDAGCAPTDNPCNAGSTSCVNGQVVCTDLQTAVADGTGCGSGKVCKGGSCVTCVADANCTPAGLPCHKGLTSCQTGTSVCMDMGNVLDSTPCTGSSACFGSYACENGACTGQSPVTCTASDSCHSVGTCNSSTGACSNPPATSGTGCGTNMACDGSGNCKCARGYTQCSSACVALASNNANCGACGHGCGSGSCNGAGVCTSWIVAHTGGTAGFQHVIASDGTNLVWLDGSGSIDQVALTGGAVITLGTVASGYTAEGIAVASGVVAWTAYQSPSMTNPFGGAGAFFTAVEGTANSGGSSPAAMDEDSAALEANGIALKPNGTTGYYLSVGGQSTVVGCTLGGLFGTCSDFAPYVAGEATDDLIIGGSTIYWTSFARGIVSSQTIGSSTVNSIASGEGGPVLLALDSTYVYWANLAASTNTYAVDRNPQTNPNPANSQNVLPSTTGTIQSLASDGKYLYYAGIIGTTGIGYVPVGGGTAKTLVTTTGSGMATVIVVGGNVYFADSDDKTIRGIAAPP